jgi:hypothetical protein
MLYESIGLLLEQAALVLDRQVREQVDDPQAKIQLEAVATLIADLGGMWPVLCHGLEREGEILAEALPSPEVPWVEAHPDPLARYRAVIAATNDEIARLYEQEPAAREARLEALREAIRQSAEVQRGVVEARDASALGSSVRRV